MPPSLITLIMNMISSTRFHILRNRTPLPEVVSSRGVRQCDLLSLYLFILCLEWLSIKVFFFFFDEKIINFIHKLGQMSIDNTSYISWSVIKGGDSSTQITLSKIDLASLAIKCAAVLLLRLACKIFQLSNF